jgi:hypothetical protein
MESYFTTDDETRKLQSNIVALKARNKKLEKMEPSELSPDQIISLTKPNLPAGEGYLKKHHDGIVKIPFIDDTVAGESKFRNAVWKLIIKDWQYQGYE